MPKKYRIEMNLVEDATGTLVDSDTDTVDYDDDSEAKDGFQDKVRAARDKGKGSE